jgi:hypothetical protein
VSGRIGFVGGVTLIMSAGEGAARWNRPSVHSEQRWYALPPAVTGHMLLSVCAMPTTRESDTGGRSMLRFAESLGGVIVAIR